MMGFYKEIVTGFNRYFYGNKRFFNASFLGGFAIMLLATFPFLYSDKVIAAVNESEVSFPWEMEISYLFQRIDQQAKECDSQVNSTHKEQIACINKVLRLVEQGIKICNQHKACVDKGEVIASSTVMLADIYGMRGYQYLLNNKVSLATTDANKVMELDPYAQSAGALFWFSFALISENRPQEAEPLIAELRKRQHNEFVTFLEGLLKPNR